MNITRRNFMKWAIISAASLGLTTNDLVGLEEVLAAETSPPVIWVQGSSCTGCSVAALNIVSPTTIDDILLNKVSMKFHPSLMAAGGQMAIDIMNKEALLNQGKFILIVEGGVPTAEYGKYCIIGENNGVHVTMLDAVNSLAPKAKYVLSIGTCATYGGIPKAGTNLTGITPLRTLLGTKTINPIICLPGCPVAPEILFSTIIKLLAGTRITLDSEGRPTEYYGTKIHSICPLKGLTKATALGQSGCCLGNMGCKGPNTSEACPNHKWNNGKNWCIGAGHHCIGCAMSTFPEAGMYKFGTYGT